MAEFPRLKGALLQLQAAPVAEIEACFEQAIRVAQQQPAKSLELRATRNFGALWQAQSRTSEAQQRLAVVYMAGLRKALPPVTGRRRTSRKRIKQEVLPQASPPAPLARQR